MSGPVDLVVLDVGGTTLAAALVAGDRVVTGPVRCPSREAADVDTIVTVFGSAITDVAGAHFVGATVVAMPGPFDEVAGVSRMRHKFAALHGVDLGARLSEVTGLAVVFVNDAQAAAAGVWVDLGRPSESVATITLGTGVGSGLIVDGEPAGHNELWCAPHDGGIVEDRVSSQALRDAYELRTGRGVSVAEVALLADEGDDEAAAAFAEYGRHLGTAAASYFADVGPAVVSVAGGVTGAWRHIEPAATNAYRDARGAGSLVRATSTDPALVGAAELGRRILRRDSPD